MQTTSIEWTEMSVNPIRAHRKGDAPGSLHVGHYCEKVSAGCRNCYASALQKRFRMPEFQESRRDRSIVPYLDEAKLMEVLRRKKPTKIFWCDMSDLFGEWVPDEWIDKCFAVMALTPQHTHQVLTKRARRMKEFLSKSIRPVHIGDRMFDHFFDHLPRVMLRSECNDYLQEHSMWPLKNVQLGVSCEDQAAADERIPLLLQTPAAVRWVSAEPLLGPINFASALTSVGKIKHLDWIVVGGESGKNARDFNFNWALEIQEQCEEAGVAFFMKQSGARPYRPEFGLEDQPGHVPDAWRVHVTDKGGDPSEWPIEFREIEFPKLNQHQNGN